MKLKAKPVDGSEIAGKHDDVVELSLGPSGLRIVIEILSGDDDNPFLEIFFRSPRGFRFLDEGDLLAYWRTQEFISRGHSVFEITDGGWKEQERQTDGMLDSTDAFGFFREWFIVTSNGCVNVIAGDPPALRRI